MRRKALILLVPVLCLALAGGVLAMASASYQLPWQVVSSGGGTRDSPSYLLGDTAGQSAVGPSQSSSYKLTGGFWSGAPAPSPPPTPPPPLTLLSQRVVSSGGGMRDSPSYLLGDTTGQSAVGSSQSSSYKLTGGFWSGAPAPSPPLTLLSQRVVSSGGGMRDSPNYLLGDTIGQSAVGLSQSSSYKLAGGFWYGAAVLLQEPPLLLGDANGDRIVDAVDITKVERIIALLDNPTPGADANRDGEVNALDITKVEMMIAGLNS